MARNATTYSGAAPLSAADVLADMRTARAKIDALGPVPVEIATNPSERLDWGGMRVEIVPVVRDALVFALAGLPVRTDPDIPPGEWWVKKSDGSHETHAGGLVPRPTTELVR